METTVKSLYHVLESWDQLIQVYKRKCNKKQICEEFISHYIISFKIQMLQQVMHLKTYLVLYS